MWRIIKSEYADQNLITTVKHDGSSMIVWGYMAAGGIGNLVFIIQFIYSAISKIKYLNILNNNLLTSVERLSLQGSRIYQ